MFLEELSPVIQELTKQPAAFLGGFFSGVLRLNLNEDPLKSWLERQGVSPYTATQPHPNGHSSRPQSISIE
ncbi:MAG: hypothetical protein ACFB4I_14420 [Cyanophyceae cyanobacterium]